MTRSRTIKFFVGFAGAGGIFMLALGIAQAAPGWEGRFLAASVGLLSVSGVATWIVAWRRSTRRNKQAREFEAALVREVSRQTYHLQRGVDRMVGSAAPLGVESRDGLTRAVGQLSRVVDELPRRMSASGAAGTSAKSTPRSRPAILEAGRAPKGGVVTVPTQVRQRCHRPITGWTAKQWSSARKGQGVFEVEEKTPAHRTGATPFASDIPVAMIADDFTFNSFRGEFDTYRIHPDNWRASFEKVKPRLFFCESAWQGGDPAKAPWSGKIYSSSRFSYENRGVLLDMIEYCRANSIPTVFWNKEDPTHYGDRINDFVRTSYLFDYIFTTAEECVESYKRDLKRDNVFVLPFAVQPRIFNPLGIHDAKDRANFAGTWYGMYPQRGAAAERIMDLVVDSGRDLVIYDRMFSNANPMYRFPERFQRYVRPAIPYLETAETFRQSKFGITLNTVTDSATMFARRVFELAASGAVVLSNTAKGVDTFFGQSVIYADREPERFLSLDETGYLELQRAALEVALANTYTHRAETILARVGIDFLSRFEAPAATGVVRSRDEAVRLVSNARSAGLIGGVLQIDNGADAGLEMRLLRESLDPDWTVVNVQQLENRDFRTRSLLGRRGVVVAGRDQSLPGKEIIRYLSGHEHYWSSPTAIASDPSDRFVSKEISVTHAYVPSASFRDAFSRSVASVLLV